MEKLVGDKIILRSVTINDATDEYVSWLNDKEVTQVLATITYPYTMEMLHDYISSILRDDRNCMFMILDKATEQAVGTIKISNIEKVNGTCNLGIMIGNRNFWGGGFGKEALRMTIDYAFNVLKIRKICDSIHSNNPRALATDLKIGFSVEGVLKEQFWHEGEGRYLDKILIALFAKDWNRK